MKELLRKILLTRSGILTTPTLQVFILLVATLFSLQVNGQKNRSEKEMKRCGTMEALTQEMLTDPELRARVEQGKIDYQNSLLPSGQYNRPASPVSLPDSVVIPVVVHVVLPNPWMITDESVEYFINRLNLDYSGLNPDSANAGSFLPLRGHSRLRFTLAKRDPNGNFTTGIIRKVGTTPINGGTNQPIKKSSTLTGGSTGWDITKYYNLYVGDGDDAGLLGISPGIGPGGAAGSNSADGICVDYRCFGPNCFSYPNYGMARTAIHEIGHNFGLYHPFDNGCATNDFSQLTSAGCRLPNSLLNPIDDVPRQSDPTTNCPAIIVSNNCNPSGPKMFQNFMDYTQDACYSMFTKGEVMRMEWVLENCRSGYLTSLGGQYPDNTVALDAMANSVVSPGGADFNKYTCAGISYPAQTCPGIFTPRLRITNAGTTNLTSITVTTSLNGLNSIAQTLAVNIRPSKSQIVELAPQNAIAGSNALTFILSQPNGNTDGNPANDTLTSNFTIDPALTLPFTESFDSTRFPPGNGWAVINPDNDETWQRTDTAGMTGASMWIHLSQYVTKGQRDIYRSPLINTTTFDSIIVSFFVAHQRYSTSSDSLRIVYSPDCGTSWYPTAYSKGSPELATVEGSSNLDFVPTSATQWRKDSVVLKDLCAGNLKNIYIGFESHNGSGNNIYIDSINIVGFTSFSTDAKIESISKPDAALCSGDFTPWVNFSNAGLDTLRSLRINYRIDNGAELTADWTGNLGKCDIGSVKLPSGSSSVGTHKLTAYLERPNDTRDLNISNDSLSKSFTIYPTVDLPVATGFEEPTFPAENWGIQNVNGADWGISHVTGGITWEKSTAGARTGNAAMRINNQATGNNNGDIDHLITPVIRNSASFDSLLVSFDHSYMQGDDFIDPSAFAPDTLEIQATTDCGSSFISVWKKWGGQLKTVPHDTNVTGFIPVSKENWQSNKVDLKQFIGASDFQLYFTSKSNRQNNIWIDNINIHSANLPQRLKNQGYLVYPNPFNGSFIVHHSAAQPPVDLQSLQVYNSAGQRVWSKEYNGNADRQITVDLKNTSGGFYILKMIYSNRTVIERIIKR